MSEKETIVCSKCNLGQRLHYCQVKNEDLKTRQLCHSCDHYMGKIPKIISGHLYLDESNRILKLKPLSHADNRMLGFGGSLGIYHDTATDQFLISNDIWMSGELDPELFGELVKDVKRLVCVNVNFTAFGMVRNGFAKYGDTTIDKETLVKLLHHRIELEENSMFKHVETLKVLRKSLEYVNLQISS